jgi:hypothetical protein
VLLLVFGIWLGWLLLAAIIRSLSPYACVLRNPVS